MLLQVCVYQLCKSEPGQLSVLYLASHVKLCQSGWKASTLGLFTEFLWGSSPGFGLATQRHSEALAMCLWLLICRNVNLRPSMSLCALWSELSSGISLYLLPFLHFLNPDPSCSPCCWETPKLNNATITVTLGIQAVVFHFCLIRSENPFLYSLSPKCHLPFTQKCLTSSYFIMKAWFMVSCRQSCHSGRFFPLCSGTLMLCRSGQSSSPSSHSSPRPGVLVWQGCPALGRMFPDL